LLGLNRVAVVCEKTLLRPEDARLLNLHVLLESGELNWCLGERKKLFCSGYA
jgi:hypothetical protein